MGVCAIALHVHSSVRVLLNTVLLSHIKDDIIQLKFQSLVY